MTTAVGASQQLDEVGDRRGTGTEFANEIFAVVDVLNRESGLRRAVSDTGSETKARQAYRRGFHVEGLARLQGTPGRDNHL
ncbi:ATP synthase delta chain [Cutibacterium acnes JCM 18916]|nr:ATP synthase delta chain [Cutibacterium acnes JCM 18916]GAE74780.1 ATP synthase delta chain [Cutibacterium acnes JCM 18918]